MLSRWKHHPWQTRWLLSVGKRPSLYTALTEQLVREANAGGKNPHMKNKIRIVKGMVENKAVQQAVLASGKVDTIISEPIGVMLFHERMVNRSCWPGISS
jgi:hypothetical protein